MILQIELTDTTIEKLAEAIICNQNKNNDRLYTIKEISEILNIPVPTLRTKNLPFVKTGKNSRKLYNKYDVIDFIRR